MLVTEGFFKTTVDVVSRAIDAGGVLILVVGLVVASGLFVRGVVGDRRNDTAYRNYRQRIGKTILLGLEFLVAADIIRTVAVDPTFRGVGVLAVIVVVRTFLSFALEVELEGQWPWQRAKVKDRRETREPRSPRAKSD